MLMECLVFWTSTYLSRDLYFLVLYLNAEPIQLYYKLEGQEMRSKYEVMRSKYEVISANNIRRLYWSTYQIQI